MPDTKTKIEIRPRIVPKTTVQEPSQYNVIYVNDDVTTQEFVIETLTSVFNYARESAETLTLRVHEEGSAVVATLPYELAEQKGIEVTLLARSSGFPLQVKIQSE
jgi:ATP-dependent Clp protease adaptor protein ClpS